MATAESSKFKKKYDKKLFDGRRRRRGQIEVATRTVRSRLSKKCAMQGETTGSGSVPEHTSTAVQSNLCPTLASILHQPNSVRRRRIARSIGLLE